MKDESAPTARHVLIWWTLVVLCPALLCPACRRNASDAPELVVFTGPTMGTQFTVKLVIVPSSMNLRALEEDIAKRLATIEGFMSTYREDSDISRLNRFQRDEWFPVSSQTAEVVDQAVQIGRLTGGAFDVTVGPVVDLWDFGAGRDKEPAVPDAAEIEQARQRVGYDRLQVQRSPPAVRKDRPDLHVDLSGIAKGYAVDQIAELLESRGVQNYLVEIGGELKGKGRNARGEPWQVAVESPVVGVRRIHRILPVEDVAVATSGDYRNFYVKDGVRYSHIIDPRSARPVSHALASVTVLDPSCTRADALATALMVLGPDAGYELALREGIEAIFIIHADDGFVERTTIELPDRLQNEPASG